MIAPDSIDGFDSYHCDTVTAYWFESQQKILMFYKGYPQYPQADQPLSPYGSCTCAAWMTPEEQIAHKLGRLMRPVPELSSWAAGWRSTLQIFPCISGGWLGITNSSPRAPGNMYELHNREPGPSLGGWAFSPEPFPTSGWVSDAQPMYWVHALPKPYYEAGIHDNLCRHHILWVDPDHIYLFFNSTGIPNDSPAGNEQLYVFRSQDV